jgi:hypothetical protein
VLTITQSGGEYKCVLDSVDQGATIPADKVTLTGDKLRLEFARVNGFYEGAINKEGNEIAGSWTQNGRAQPLSFKRKEQDASASAQPAATGAQKPFTSPIDVTVAISPAAFQADGKSHVSYELVWQTSAGILRHCRVSKWSAMPAPNLQSWNRLTC